MLVLGYGDDTAQFKLFYAIRTTLDEIRRRGGGHLLFIPQTDVTEWRMRTFFFNEDEEFDFIAWPRNNYEGLRVVWNDNNKLVPNPQAWPFGEGEALADALALYKSLPTTLKATQRQQVFNRVAGVATVDKGRLLLDEALKKMDPNYPTDKAYPWIIGIGAAALLGGLVYLKTRD